MNDKEDNNLKVYSAMNAVQAGLVKIGIGKKQKNAEQNYMFRGIDDVYDALSPLLVEHKLLILPRMTGWECREFKNSRGNVGFHVKVDAKWDFISSEDGSRHVLENFGEAIDYSDKGTNKAMSAAYKYAVIQAFSIPVHGEDDADATTPAAGLESLDADVGTGRVENSTERLEKALFRRPAPKTEAAGDEGEVTWEVTVQEIADKMTKADKPYKVLSLSNGETLSLFDKKDWPHFHKGQEVRIIVKQKGKYWNYAGVEESSEELPPTPKRKETYWDASIVDVLEDDEHGYFEITFDNNASAFTKDAKLAKELTEVTAKMRVHARRNTLDTRWSLVTIEELDEVEA